MADKSPTEPSPITTGFKGCCPRCGAHTLFAGWIRFADRCGQCGLDFTAFNVGDGPAAFLTLVLGGLVAAMAITVELALSPPFWVHLIVWPPITLALILASLRASKGVLLALEYRNAAREGQISER